MIYYELKIIHSGTYKCGVKYRIESIVKAGTTKLLNRELYGKGILI